MHAATIGVRGRLIGCVIAMVAIAAMAFAPSASAVEPPVSTYLSLGDSLAFGYTQTKFEENFPNDVPAYFEGGFSDQFARKVRANKEEPANKGLVIVNNGCPGESTDSFISKEAAEAQGEVTCGYQA